MALSLLYYEFSNHKIMGKDCTRTKSQFMGKKSKSYEKKLCINQHKLNILKKKVEFFSPHDCIVL